MIFTKNLWFCLISFYFYYIYFFRAIIAPLTLKSSWNFQELALIRAFLFIYILKDNETFCFDFCNKSNGKLVLGVVYFFKPISTILLANFGRFSLYHSFNRLGCPKNICRHIIFHLWSFFVKLFGFENCLFGQFGQLTRKVFRAVNAQAEIQSLGVIVPN